MVTACVGMMVDGVFGGGLDGLLDGGLAGGLGGTGMGSVGVAIEEPHRAQNVPLSCWAPHCGQNMASLPRRGPVRATAVDDPLQPTKCPAPLSVARNGDSNGKA